MTYIYIYIQIYDIYVYIYGQKNKKTHDLSKTTNIFLLCRTCDIDKSSENKKNIINYMCVFSIYFKSPIQIWHYSFQLSVGLLDNIGCFWSILYYVPQIVGNHLTWLSEFSFIFVFWTLVLVFLIVCLSATLAFFLGMVH